MRTVSNLWAGYETVTKKARQRAEQDIQYLFDNSYGKVSEVVWRRFDRTFTMTLRLWAPDYFRGNRADFTVSGKSVQEVEEQFNARWSEWAKNTAFAASLIAEKRAQDTRASVERTIKTAESWERRANALRDFAGEPRP